MNETSTGNGSTQAVFEIPTKDFRILESFIMTSMVFYIAVVACQVIVTLIIRLRNRKVEEPPAMNFSVVSRLSKFSELFVILLSATFCICYFVTYYLALDPVGWRWFFITFFLASSKLLTEIQTIMMSLVPISTFLSNLTKTGWEWTEPITAAVLRAIGRFVVLKDFVMISWIIMSYYVKHDAIMQALYFYFGLHLSVQFLLLLPVIIQCCPDSKPWKSMSLSEKMSYMQALLFVLFKLPILANILYMAATQGTKNGMIFVCWYAIDIYLLPTTVRYLDMCMLVAQEIKKMKNAAAPIVYEMKA